MRATPVPNGPTLSDRVLWARHYLAIRPNLNEPESTAHEYLSFPLLLCPTDESSRFRPVWWPVNYSPSRSSCIALTSTRPPVRADSLQASISTQVASVEL